MCINKRVVGGLALVAVALFALAPSLLGALAPVLMMAACPLSMVLMMRGMSGRDRVAPTDDDARLRDLESEVDRLRAELAWAERPEPGPQAGVDLNR